MLWVFGGRKRRCGASVAVLLLAFSTGALPAEALDPTRALTQYQNDHWQTEQGQKLIQMLPRKRVGQPEDLDALVVLLASNQSHFINGAVIAADDGFGV